MADCRLCNEPLSESFCDLDQSPPSNAYLSSPDQKEAIFPLHAYVCSHCFLVQLGQFQLPEEIFGQYSYFSSYSKSWLEHAKIYTEQVIERFSLGKSSHVIEIASNDGYLLQNFLARGISHLGIEPARNVAEAARSKGVQTLSEFFGLKLAKTLKPADLIIGNNVLAHVPDLNDFVAGMKALLAPNGVITLEFPHFLRLFAENQFDTIYHEHFSYFSLLSAEEVFSRHHLALFDVEQLSTHGGSLRVYLQHKGGLRKVEPSVAGLRNEETSFGLNRLETYRSFAKRTDVLKREILSFFELVKAEGKTIAGYGAPAKGNTLLNFCRITRDLLPFTVDLSPHKQGLFLPGSRIPILPPSAILEQKPDYLLILPWNLKEEIVSQMQSIRKWGGKFVFFIPNVAVYE